MMLDVDDAETLAWLNHYLALLDLPREQLQVTTTRSTFERWLGRRVGSSLGGAYAYLARQRTHAVFINLRRIDRSKPRSVEIVVAEELVHMRDRLDGDLRRHAKHGHDRIARRVAALTGASLDEIRSCLIGSGRRAYRYTYACPACGITIQRRRRGTWSCARCSPAFDRRYVLQLVAEDVPSVSD